MAGYYPGSTPLQPQRLVGTARRNLGGGAGNAMGGEGGMSADPRAKAAADWLATVNLSKGPTHDYPFKTLPRPTGRATRMIVTEYDLPRKTIEPHDVIVDSDGMVWYSDFGALFLGKMDPKTGKVTEYPIPKIKEGFPVGTLDLEADRDGNIWVAMMYQGGVAKLDQEDRQGPDLVGPEGMADRRDAAVLRLADLLACRRQGVGEELGPGADPAIAIRRRTVGELRHVHRSGDEAHHRLLRHQRRPQQQSLHARLQRRRTSASSTAPRRSWRSFARRFPIRGRAGAASTSRTACGSRNTTATPSAMLDPKTRQIKEWPVPTPWSNPYDVVVDKNGEAWTGSMMTDRIVRLDTKTGRFTEYLLPNPTNIRRVWVDNSTTPVTFWVGSNHGASIVKAGAA